MNSSEFWKINSKNVIAISFLYYLMSDSKKRKNNKTANMILNLIKNSFIERNVRYFQIWLNRFRHDFFQSKKNRNLVFKIYTNKINKLKAISSASNQFEKKNLNRIKNFNSSMKKFKNENLIYKIFIVHTIEHSIQNQREQFHKIEKLKRKFDDLFRKMKNYFWKSIEFLNDRNIIANRDRVHIKNRDRIKNQNHSRNQNKSREKKILKIVIKSSNIITVAVQISVSETAVVEIKTKNINENENFIINHFRILNSKKISESYSKNENECLQSIKNSLQFIRNRLKRIEIKIENENVFEIEKIFEKKKLSRSL